MAGVVQNNFCRGVWVPAFAGTTVSPMASLRFAGELFHRDAEVIGKHGFDDPLFLGIELLPGRRNGGLIDQRLGAGDRRGRVLRQPLGEFARLCLQLCCRNDAGDQAPLIGLLRGKTVFGQKDLQCAPGAAGAGMGLAFVADLCIAADDARFTPAYAKIGVSPDGGSTVGMVGTVGTRRALQIFLAEDSFTAQQAYQWGLVARVVPAAELKAETRKFAERLAQNPPAAIAGTKSLVYQAAVTPTRQQLDAEEKGIIEAMLTEDFRVAVKKFTSKGK